MKRRRIVRAVDLFCGAGGFDSGFVRLLCALGIPWVLSAVNHWHRALETHALNHPGAERYLKDIHALTEFDIQNLVWGPPGKHGRRKRPWLDILLASPTCVMHSQARGGLPINDQQRMDPWAIINWITALHGRVRCVLIENVPLFPKWGPLNEKGRPLAGLEGLHFRAWVAALQALGFKVEWRIICCADYGDATTRERFFLQARKDGKPIRWPPETHQDPEQSHVLSLFGEERLPWRSAADHVIDWSDLGQSIIDRDRSLKPNTVNRVGTGAVRYGGAYAEVLDAVMDDVRYRARLEEFWTAPVTLADLGDPAENPGTGYSAAQLLAMARTGQLVVTGKPRKKARRRPGAKELKTRRVLLPAPADPELHAAWRSAREAYAEAGCRHPARDLHFQTRGDKVVRVQPGEPWPDASAIGVGALAQTDPLMAEAAERSWLVTMWGTGGGRSVHNPAPGFSAQGGHLALATPFVFPANQGGGRTRGILPVTRPLRTILTADSFALAATAIRSGPGLAPLPAGPLPYVCANRMNNAPRSARGPVCGATTATGGGIFLGVPMLLGQHGGAQARSVVYPVPTVATDGAISISFPLMFSNPPAAVAGPGDESRGQLDVASSFLLCANHTGDGRFYLPAASAIPTLTQRRGLALATSAFWLQPYYSAYNGRVGAGAVPVVHPVPAVTTKSRFGFLGWHAEAAATPWLISTRQLSPGYGPAPRSVHLPPPTITGGGSQLALLSPQIQGAWTALPSSTGSSATSAANAFVVGIDHANGGNCIRSVSTPVGGLVTKQNVALAAPALVLPTAGARPTGRAVYIDGWLIYVDIRFRMLTNRELSRAMSFDDEDYEYTFAGTQEEITRQIGNAVPVRTARALCSAMLWDILEAHAPEQRTETPPALAA
jgi:site-specific DNA-cytosine methylase